MTNTSSKSAVAPSSRSWRAFRFAARLALVLVGVAAALALVELAARIASPRNPFSPYLTQPYVRLDLSVRLPGIAPTGRFTTNRWGMRGPEPPADWERSTTIVAIGGSTTQCFYLDDARTWPALLADRLRQASPGTWVGNAGVDGHSSRAHRHVLEHVVAPLGPDTILVLAGINDLGIALSRDPVASPGEPGEAGFDLLKQSRLLQLARLWWKRWFARAFAVSNESHGPYTPRPRSTAAAAPAAPGHSPMADAAGFDAGSFLAEYEANLRSIARTARAHGIAVVFITQPLLYTSSAEWEAIEGELFWIPRLRGPMSAAEIARLMDRYNDVMRRVATDENAMLVDAASSIAGDPASFYDPCHFTERGAERLADLVAERLGAPPRDAVPSSSPKP